MEIEVPDSYDWRNEYPHCSRPVPTISQGCQSTYIESSLSAVEDRICKENGKYIKLSSQELIDCDKANQGCKGGNVNKVLTWGKRKGFIPETCYETTGEQGECPEEHLTENSCRQQNNFFKIIDFCLAQQIDGIKREILTNGPVLAQMTPNTDFLTYKDGIYARTSDSFKYNGNHLVKIVGWEYDPEGTSFWIVENTWGGDWGEDGFAKIMSGGDSMLDFYALGFAAYPWTMAEYYSQQQQSKEKVHIDPMEFSDFQD